MSECIQCDVCNITYYDKGTISTAKVFAYEYKNISEKAGLKVRGLLPCPVLQCKGEMILLDE